MALSKKELKERWETEDGKKRLAKIVVALQTKKQWTHRLVDFSGVDEVQNGRDLRGVDLPESDFKNVDLREVFLSQANLRNSNLEGAELFRASLVGVNLDGACLAGAALYGANLAHARLGAANCKDAMLLEVNLDGAWLGSADLRNAEVSESSLDGAMLPGADLRNASLGESSLKRADFRNANLSGADLRESDLESACFSEATLNDADFREANLGSACFTESVLAGAILKNNHVNNGSDFRVSNLEVARCDNQTRNHLEYNTRRLNWEDWYNEHKLLQWPVGFFWWLTNYGTAQSNLLLSFFTCAFLFAVIFSIWPGMIQDLSTTTTLMNVPVEYETVRFGPQWSIDMPVEFEQVEMTTTEPWWPVFLRACYFSVVTMTTLGFGDLHATPFHIWGQLLLGLQVLIGYFFLGALITRLGILFQSEGPTGIGKSMRKETSIE